MSQNGYFKEVKDILTNVSTRLDKVSIELEQVSTEIYELKERQKKTDEQLKKTDEHLKKTDEHLKKTDEHLKKTDEQLKKTDEHLKKTDEHLKKTDEQIRKTDEQIRKTTKELERQGKKMEEYIKKTEEEIERVTKKTSREIERVNKMVGNLTDGWGRFVEAIVCPSIPKLFSRQGIKIIDISTRKERHKGGDTLEVDIFAIGRIAKRDIILLTDVKSNLDARTIDYFVENILSRFFNFFPEYRKAEVMGVVAGMRIGGGAERYAESKGLWILGPSEDLVKFINKKGFKPKIWRYEKPLE